MKPVKAILLNAILLLTLGVWGYLAVPENRSMELIAVVFSVLFFAALPLFRQNNRIVEFILRVLLLLLAVALILSFLQALREKSIGHAIRLGLMTVSTLLTCGVLLVVYVERLKSRKNERRNNDAPPGKYIAEQNKGPRDG